MIFNLIILIVKKSALYDTSLFKLHIWQFISFIIVFIFQFTQIVNYRYNYNEISREDDISFNFCM